MRILHLDSGREMRGGQWQVLRLHRGLIADGIDSMLLTRPESPLGAMAANEGLPCEAMKMDWRGYDLVHAHDAASHTRAALFGKAPLVVSRRVAFPVKRSLLSSWKYRRPRLFLAVSNYVASQLRSAGVPDEKISVIYDGVAVPPHASVGRGVFLFQKEMRVALDGLETISDLAGELPHARALVYLTKSEGLGSGILLAMAHGVTVIASHVGGIPELIRDGFNGMLVQNEASSVAAALDKLDDRMGQAARVTVTERFTEERMVSDTIAAYKRVLAG